MAEVKPKATHLDYAVQKSPVQPRTLCVSKSSVHSKRTVERKVKGSIFLCDPAAVDKRAPL